MSLGEDDFDGLAHALVETAHDLDAVERGSLRAEWIDDGLRVEVTDRERGRTVVYSADDLVVATSDREVRNARQSEGG